MRAAGRCDAHKQCQGTQGTEPGPGTSCHNKQCWCSTGDGAGGQAALHSTGVSPKFVFPLHRQNSWGRDGVGGRALAHKCWFWGAVRGSRLSPSPPTATASYPRPEVTALPGRHFNCSPNYGLIWTFKVLWEGGKEQEKKGKGLQMCGAAGGHRSILLPWDARLCAAGPGCGWVQAGLCNPGVAEERGAATAQKPKGWFKPAGAASNARDNTELGFDRTMV